MGLFDIFSSDQGEQNARLAYNAQNKALKDARGAITNNYGSAITGLNNAQDVGQGYLTSGYNTATDALNNATLDWRNLYDMGKTGLDKYYGLLDNPDSVFNSELYKTREAAGIDELNRGANSRGMLASGNNSQDILDYMRKGGLDYFNTILGGYQPSFGLATNAAQGLSSQYGKLADLAYGYGLNRSNLATGTAQNVANVQTGQGRELANLRTQQGQAGADMYGNINNAQTAAAEAPWNLILGLANAGAKVAGGVVG